MMNRVRSLFAAAPTLPPLGSPWADTPLTRLTLEEVFGTNHITIDRAAAMAIGTVARGRNLITGQIGHFALTAHRGTEPLKTPPAWLERLEKGRPRSVTLAWIVDALLFYGRAFLLIDGRDWSGQITAFRFVPEWKAKTDGAGSLIAAFDQHVNANDWIRIDAPVEGLLTTAADDLRDMITVKAAAARTAENPVPALELHQTGGDPLTDDEIDALTARWAEKRRARNGGVAYTNQSIEAKTHGTNTEQLLIEARQEIKLDLANHLNLPAWAVDASTSGSSLTYSNVPSRTRELIDYTLTPLMDAIAGRLSLDDVLPRGAWCQFDTTTALRGSFNDRMTGYKTAIDAGIYTVEEIRRIENGIPLEAGT